MSKPARAVAGLALGVALGGCVTMLPVAASSAIAKGRSDARKAARAPTVAPDQPPTARPITDAGGRWTVVTGARDLPPPSSAPPSGTLPAGPPPAAGTPVPPGMQYLYGSGEGAATSRQAYRALAGYLETLRYRRADTVRQVVLGDGATLAAPQFEPCGQKPRAIVLDVDETALLNLGYEADEAARGLTFDAVRWQRWEATGAARVVAVPGAKDALDAARAAGFTVVFNTNRTDRFAAQTEAALNGAALGPAEHGKTLWLKGDAAGGSAKDDRRRAIATSYCVVAMVGDQLGDFSDLFNDPALTPAARRAATAQPGIAELWGAGWFVLPNPVYGPALQGASDDIFPADRRWVDPGTLP